MNIELYAMVQQTSMKEIISVESREIILRFKTITIQCIKNKESEIGKRKEERGRTMKLKVL